MKSFEIVNTKSGTSMGTWEAASAAEALDKYASDAGYQDFADACTVASGDDIEAREVKVAVEALRNEIKTWAATDKANGVTVGSDGSLPEITAEMLGRRVDALGLDEDKADAFRVELMELWTRETAVAVDDDLCERWLGRDWPESTSPAEAMRIATACQAKRDEGDARDYTAILAEVIG